jgi:LptD protein/Sec-independent protein translocase protein (TatC)
VNPQFFSRNRPFALVIAAVVAAVLTPPDAVSMLMLLIPLMLLYEAGIIVGRVVWRRRAADLAKAALVLLALAAAGPASAQDKPPPRRPVRDSLRTPGDTARRGDTTQGLDTAAARRLGLPTGPTRNFPEADSVLRALLGLEGYRLVRYAADSVVLFADSQAVALVGQGLVEQEGATLEADTVRFRQSRCELRAAGGPTLFQRGSVLVGDRMRYDTCERRGFVDSAITNFTQSGVDWFLRGGLSVDSASVRLFARRSSLTSCDLPEPTYHFASSSVKWVNNTIMVARPAVLYVRDVPVLWLPFIFQDMRPGRRSGLLVPRFGINDIVRPSTGYRRHVSNVGYYFAVSDYFDFLMSMDWFSETSVTANAEFRYRWLNRFLEGGLRFERLWESGFEGTPGGRSLRLGWNHRQAFDLRTRLTASVDYATSARVVERNAVDPYLATATLGSNLSFSKQFDWGNLALGGQLRQDLTTGGTTQQFPSVSLTPVPIDLTSFITWSPGFTFTTDRTYNQRGGTAIIPPLPGDTAPRLDTLLVETRASNLSFSTPLRIGGWNWQNSFTMRDEIRETAPASEPAIDPLTGDTIGVNYFGLDFATAVDWNTGFSLPSLFPGSWKLQPSVGIQNSTSGPFLLRNRNTGGQYVRQGKRLSFGAQISPSFFGFFPGIGPIARIRHKVSPVVRWGFAPAANVPLEYARAIAGAGRAPELRSLAQHRVSLGLSQNIEGKLATAGDTTGDPRNARKIKILSLETSDISYDFEQAKQPGRNGWTTQSLSNQLTSDLLPGFSLSTTHDLWRGPVGYDSAAFDPFLSRVSARFSISEGTLRGVARLLTGRSGAGPGEAEPQAPADTTTPPELIPRDRGDRFRDFDRRPRPTGRQPFSLAVTYDDQRQRPDPGQAPRPGQDLTNRTLGLSFSFDPTRNWSLSWSTQYNLTTKEFGQHVVRLERDLRRWRASFQFLKSPNGNFAFNFFISLLDQPDIKFNYDQQTIEERQQ